MPTSISNVGGAVAQENAAFREGRWFRCHGAQVGITQAPKGEQEPEIRGGLK